MKMPETPEAYNEILDRIVGYFDPIVLAAYRAEPDKYEVKTDFFEGEVRTTESHYASLDEGARSAAYIGVRFGFRTLADGSLALAAYLPDLIDRSREHLPRWQGFLIREPHWSDYRDDERFKRWVQRYFDGSWDVDNGPAHYLGEGIRLINGLTQEAVGSPLFDLAHDPHIDFRRHIDDVHQSEALIVYFDDGSIMSLDTGSNADNVMPGQAESFHVDLHIDWVPAAKMERDKS